MILKPEHLDDMTAEQVTAEFVRLATERHGAKFKTAICREFGVNRDALATWLTKNQVPPLVIYVLSIWQADAELTGVEHRIKKLAAALSPSAAGAASGAP